MPADLKEIIESLGTISEVARGIHVTRPTLYYWIKKNRIPDNPNYRKALKKLLTKKRIKQDILDPFFTSRTRESENPKKAEKIKELVEALGGRNQAAEICNISPPIVNQWFMYAYINQRNIVKIKRYIEKNPELKTKKVFKNPAWGRAVMKNGEADDIQELAEVV